MNRRDALTVLASAPLVAQAEIDFSSLSAVERAILRACSPGPNHSPDAHVEDKSSVGKAIWSLHDRGYLKLDGVCSRGIKWMVRTELGDRALASFGGDPC